MLHRLADSPISSFSMRIAASGPEGHPARRECGITYKSVRMYEGTKVRRSFMCRVRFESGLRPASSLLDPGSGMVEYIL
jgi:hypothetical protein